MKAKRKPLRVIWGIILGFSVFVIVSQVLRLLGPFVGGLVTIAFDLTPDPRTADNLESVGNIFVLIVSFYLGIKSYKKIAGKKPEPTTAD